MGKGDQRAHHRRRQRARKVSQPVEDTARRGAHPGWVAFASRAKCCAPVPHIKVLKLIAAMMASGVSRCITAAAYRRPAIEIKQAAARLSTRSESHAPITSRQHGDERHRRQPARMPGGCLCPTKQQQPAVDAPQVGQESDVKDADDPEVRADKQLAPCAPLVL